MRFREHAQVRCLETEHACIRPVLGIDHARESHRKRVLAEKFEQGDAALHRRIDIAATEKHRVVKARGEVDQQQRAAAPEANAVAENLPPLDRVGFIVQNHRNNIALAFQVAGAALSICNAVLTGIRV